jgi:hypothetical protein
MQWPKEDLCPGCAICFDLGASPLQGAMALVCAPSASTLGLSPMLTSAAAFVMVTATAYTEHPPHES